MFLYAYLIVSVHWTEHMLLSHRVSRTQLPSIYCWYIALLTTVMVCRTHCTFHFDQFYAWFIYSDIRGALGTYSGLAFTLCLIVRLIIFFVY